MKKVFSEHLTTDTNILLDACIPLVSLHIIKNYFNDGEYEAINKTLEAINSIARAEILRKLYTFSDDEIESLEAKLALALRD
jgi:hypothetical protein